MDVITTTSAEKIAEKKKIKHRKLNERRKLKKRMNRMNQNVEISSKENCQGLAEVGAYVGPGVDLENSYQIDRAHAEEIAEKNKTQSEILNGMTRKNPLMNPTNQNSETSYNEKRHVIDETGSSVESLLRGSSQEDRAPNDTVENKTTAFKDEPLPELSKGERVLGDTVKENSNNETKKRKRKSKRKGGSNDKLEPTDQDHKDPHISNNEKSCNKAEVGLGVDVISLVENSPKDKVGQVILNQENKCLEKSVERSCISETDSGIKDVDLTAEPVLQESAEVEEVSTEIAKEKQNPEGKQRRKKKKAENKVGKSILVEEDKCLPISADSRSCIAAVESGINGVDSVVESVLQESLKVEEVSTEIAKEDNIPGGKRERKKKSEVRNKDGNALLDEEVQCRKVSVDGKSCIAAAELGINSVDSTVEPLLQESPKVEEISTEIVQKQNTPKEKEKRKRKSKDRDKDEKVVVGEEDKCLKIFVESNCGIAAAELDINIVDSTVEPPLQESPKVEEVSTEIVQKQNTPKEKQRRKRKSKDRDKDEKVIVGEGDKCPKISVESNSGIAAAELRINSVDSTVEPLLQESQKDEGVLTEIVQKQHTPKEKQKRKRKSKNRDKDEKVIVGEGDKSLKISVESNTGIAAAELGINSVDSTVERLLQESPKVEEVPTEIVQKQQNTPKEKQKRKRKSKDRGTDEKVIVGEEDKSLKISVESNSVIAAAELGINCVDSTVEPLLQESPKVEEVSTEIVQKQHTPKEKQKRKRKSKNRDTDEKVIVSEEDKCLKNSVESNSGIRAAELGIDSIDSIVEPVLQESPRVEEVKTDIVKKQNTPKEKQKREGKSKDRDTDEKVIVGEADKCLKISVESNCGIAAAELGINIVDSTVEPPLQESPKVEEVSTEIVQKQNTPKEKQRRKRKSKDWDKDEKVIVGEGDKCPKISVESNSGVAAAELGINCVDSTVEPLLHESPKVEGVPTEIVQKQHTPKENQKRKRKSKNRDKDEKVIVGERDKSPKISVVSNTGIAAAELGINSVDSTVEPLLQESPKVEEVPTEIVQKQQNTPKEKQKRKRKSKDRGTEEKVVVGEEDKSLKISVESNSVIAAAELGINCVDSTVEPLLQESPKVDKLSTEIVQKQNTPKEKHKKKRKSKDRNKDEKVIIGVEDNCLKISVESSSGIAAAELGINNVDSTVEPLLQESPMVEEVSTEIAKEPRIPAEKHKRKRKLKDRDNDGKVILGEDDKCLKISADRKTCVTAAEAIISDIDLNVESLLQDSVVVDKASTEIVEEKKSAEGKRRRRRKLKIRSENNVEVPIVEQQDEPLLTSTDGRCCTYTEMGTLQGVDSRSECPPDVVSFPVINAMVDLPNGLYQLPQRAVTTCSRRILLILDINGLLADIVMPPPKERKSDINMLGRAIFKRPYCDDFLNFCFDTFDVGIWSSRTKRVIDKVVDYLLGKRRQKLLFCWDMSHTTASKFKTLENRYKPLVCKSLRNLWDKRDPSLPWEKGDYTESNTLLIDDSPYKALLNPMHTAIFPYSFTFKDLHDNSLGPGGEIRVYLENLAKTDDVRTYVEQHPFGQSAITEKSSSWDFYSKVLSSLSRF